MSRRSAVVLLVLASFAGACGLPDDRSPRIISAAEAPLDLGDPAGGSAGETPEGNAEVELFFVRDGLLESVMRTAPNGDLSTTIALLLTGPADGESALSTSIPSETELNSATVDGETAVLDLGCLGDVPIDQCGVLAVGGQDQLTLFAQLACTATDVDGVDGVRFLQDGEPQDAPTDSGTTQSPAAVSCADYRSLQ